MSASQCLLALVLTTNIAAAQDERAVQWLFKTRRLANDEVVVDLTARVAPGWHLYSQFIGEGGPQPTEIVIDFSDDFELLGKPEEIGKQVKVHDEIYEMDITWYTGVVFFLQKVRLRQPSARLTGKVTYMVCNDHICVPGERNFNLLIGD